jgi:hypothetical protein
VEILAKKGSTQKKLLFYISKEPYSVYDLHPLINKKIDIDIKNVRKTVNRLHTLELIEIEGYYPRNAKKYRLTSYGLFQLLSSGPIPRSILDVYNDDIIVQTRLFQYFELDTIREWMNLQAPFLLARYVHRCCDAILSSLEESRSLTKKLYSTDLRYLLEKSIEREKFNFVFEILINSNKLKSISPDKDLIPEIALAKDSMFTASAQLIRKNIEDGCKHFEI